MDDILNPIRDAVEGTIDFQGQQLADSISYVALVLTGIIAFIVGYVQQDVHQTLYIGLGGGILTLLLVVPPWPFYKRKPVAWISPLGQNVTIQVN